MAWPWRGIARRLPTGPVGRTGEALAARFLESRGMRIVARNLRCRLGEIDLVARDGAILVLVEVKTRRASGGVLPQEAVDGRKQARLARLARGYLARQRLGDVACRIDVVAVTLDPAGGPPRLDHFVDAFAAGEDDP
jgi:putative endonuclease